MDQFEIHARVVEKNRQIKELLTPDSFVLNEAVRDLLDEIRSLQSMCKHEFDEQDHCIYCLISKERI